MAWTILLWEPLGSQSLVAGMTFLDSKYFYLIYSHKNYKFTSIFVQKYGCISNTEMAKVINLHMKQQLTSQSKTCNFSALYRNADRWHSYPVRTLMPKWFMQFSLFPLAMFVHEGFHLCVKNVLQYLYHFGGSCSCPNDSFSQLLKLLPVTLKFDTGFQQQYATKFLFGRKSCNKLTWRQKSITR